MKRVKITENGEFYGSWYNPDSAILTVKEETYWNGHNWVSNATGHQFYHEKLVYTKSGKFIINAWSDYRGSQETNELMTDGEAVLWILKNEFNDLDFLDALPKKVKEKVLAEIENLEV